MKKFVVVFRSGERMKQEVGQLEFEVDETQGGDVNKLAAQKAQEIIKQEKKLTNFKIISVYPAR